MGIYDKIFKPKKLVLSDGKVVEEKRTRTPLVLFLLLIATVISVRITGFSLNTILTRGNQFFVILGQMFQASGDHFLIRSKCHCSVLLWVVYLQFLLLF